MNYTYQCRDEACLVTTLYFDVEAKCRGIEANRYKAGSFCIDVEAKRVKEGAKSIGVESFSPEAEPICLEVGANRFKA